MEYHLKSREEVEKFIVNEVLTSSEVLDLLGVTRQTLNSLVKRGKLKPVKELSREKLFLRHDVEERKREAAALRGKYRPFEGDSGEN